MNHLKKTVRILENKIRTVFFIGITFLCWKDQAFSVALILICFLNL